MITNYHPDSTQEFIDGLKPIKVKGLYAYDDNGNKLIPKRIYFGIDTRLWSKNGQPCGNAYYHYDCALRIVYKKAGMFHIEGLANVICDYDGTWLRNFRKG